MHALPSYIMLSRNISNRRIITFPLSVHDIDTSIIKLDDLETAPGMWI